MLSKLRQRAQNEQGFTLIELLVVILIIGILAAIAIPSFLNQKTKANDAAAKVMARTAQTAAETFATDNNGSYAGMGLSNLTTIEPTLADTTGASISGVGGTSNTYSIQVTSKTPDTNLFIVQRSSTGSLTRTCTTAGTGACPASGTW